jgi:hypothetical protein
MAARPEKAEEVRVSSWQVDEKIVSGRDPLFAKELLRSRHGERDLDARNQSNATLLSQATTQPFNQEYHHHFTTPPPPPPRMSSSD